ADKYEVEIHAWVFMINHVHLLMTPQKDHGISQMMQALGRQYVRYYNYTYKRSGTLWEGHHLDTSVLNAIRTSVSKGLALGDNRFKLQI
ncbi:MAG TPA: transposase, partial [Cellvibrio sp.]